MEEKDKMFLRKIYINDVFEENNINDGFEEKIIYDVFEEKIIYDVFQEKKKSVGTFGYTTRGSNFFVSFCCVEYVAERILPICFKC